MTIFETQTYTKDDGNIVGAQVTAEYEGNIERVSVVDEEALNSLVARLDVLDETYVQFEEDSGLAGSTIDELLINENEDVPINAVTLSGFSSDSFSKTNHTHNFNTLRGVLNYELSSSAYDIDKSDTVTLKVKVSDATKSPVANSPVTLLLDGSSFANGNTNAGGEFTTTYTPSEYGLKHFSVNNTSIDINVRDSSTSQSSYYSNKVWVYYNKELKMCQVVLNGEFSISSSGDLISDFPFKPRKTTAMAIYNAGMSMSISDSGTIRYLNSGTTGSKTVVASATFFYQ